MADTKPIEKTYLSVPYEQREAAKAAGALWDKKAKVWFAIGTEVPDGLTQFLQANRVEPSREDPRTAFGKFLRDNGAQLQGLPDMDGKWHRIALVGDGKETNASYRGFLDGVPNGQFKNFKGDDVPLQWTGTGDALTAEEKQKLTAEAAQNREIRERERAKEQQATAKIKAAEASMVAELRERAAALATATASDIITRKLDESASLALVDNAAAEIEKLN